MVKIINPLWRHGKIILKYTGNNVRHKNIDTEIKRVEFVENFDIGGTILKALLKFKVFDESEIIISLKSAEIYFKIISETESSWERSDEDFIPQILTDNHYIIFKGIIGCNKIVGHTELYFESYEITAIFSNKESKIIDTLKTENIHYQIFN